MCVGGRPPAVTEPAAMRHIADLRVRAERRLGELLKRMAENGERAAKKNGRPSEVQRGAAHTLKDLGIPRDRASRAMQLAAVPAEAEGM